MDETNVFFFLLSILIYFELEDNCFTVVLVSPVCESTMRIHMRLID